MGNHDDQLFPRDLPQDLHDLNAGLGIQRTGRFIRQQDIRVVDQRTGNRNPLHLSARHLGRPFADLVAKPDLFQCFDGTAAAFCLTDPRQGQCQLDVCQNRLVRNQVVALEHKADAVVAVAVPVTVAEFLSRPSVDDQVAAGILVQTADDIEQRRLARTGWAED